MKRLWSPWRSQYIATFAREPRRNRSVSRRRRDCVLCTAARARKDERKLVLWRGKHCFIIMNRYPYNSGHIMVVPYKHASSLTRLADDEHLEILHAIQRSLKALESTVSPHGFNIGVNLGRASGAGIDDHVHYHVVPRWSGDTNFMPVFADVKVISEDMKRTWRRLRKAMKD